MGNCGHGKQRRAETRKEKTAQEEINRLKDFLKMAAWDALV
jgi:hypothetical protein